MITILIDNIPMFRWLQHFKLLVKIIWTMEQLRVRCSFVVSICLFQILAIRGRLLISDIRKLIY